jgi:hypothetical protein
MLQFLTPLQTSTLTNVIIRGYIKYMNVTQYVTAYCNRYRGFHKAVQRIDHIIIHLFSSLSHDRSKVSFKVSSPHSAV